MAHVGAEILLAAQCSLELVADAGQRLVDRLLVLGQGGADAGLLGGNSVDLSLHGGEAGIDEPDLALEWREILVDLTQLPGHAVQAGVDPVQVGVDPVQACVDGGQVVQNEGKGVVAHGPVSSAEVMAGETLSQGAFTPVATAIRADGGAPEQARARSQGEDGPCAATAGRGPPGPPPPPRLA